MLVKPFLWLALVDEMISLTETLGIGQTEREVELWFITLILLSVEIRQIK